MALKLPGSLILTFGLLAAGFLGGAVSLGVQRWQKERQAEADAHVLTGGDATLGKLAFARHRCGACHGVRGLDGADGETGPPLDKIAVRAVLAGQLANDPKNMIAWVQHPQAVHPGGAMPELGMSDAEARDVAAFLYTLR